MIQLRKLRLIVEERKLLRALKSRPSEPFDRFLGPSIWGAFADPAPILDSALLSRLYAGAGGGPDGSEAPSDQARQAIESGLVRAARVTFGGTEIVAGGTATPRLNDPGTVPSFTIYFTDDFASGLVVDEATRRVLEGGPGDWAELGGGRDDVLELAGDYSEGFALPAGSLGLDRIVLHRDGDFFLIAEDDSVGAGGAIVIDGSAVGRTIGFDGSQESDGRFIFLGGSGDDLFVGGAGDDRAFGGGGADVLRGGGGRDVFVYTAIAESTGSGHDLLAEFDLAEDRIDLSFAVSGFAATVGQGRLSFASFDDDLSAALGAAQLGSGQAVWFTPDEGDLAGTIFLVVDGNGEAGYQAGEDFVFALPGAPIADLGASAAIFV